MNIELEKKRIIEEIIHVQDEWLLKAIKKLLDIDFDESVSEEHRQILNERAATYGANPDNVIDWEKIKKDLFKK